MKNYNSILQLLFSAPTQKIKKDDEKQIRIYTEDSFSSFIGIDPHPNLHVGDILKLINPQFNEAIKQDVDLVLSTSAQSKEGIKLMRRLWVYERLEEIFMTKPSHLTYQLLLVDFTRKNLKKHTQNNNPNFDENFEIYGKLLKKNQKGIYVETKGYLSKHYFGFFNENKQKLKLSNLDSIKLFVWEDQNKYAFKILNNRKLYFFKAYKESDYYYWLNNLEKYLESAHFRSILISQESAIIENARMQVNKMEELVYLDFHEQIEIDDLEFLKSVKKETRNCLDYNLVTYLLDKKEEYLIEIQTQIQNDSYSLLSPFDQIDRSYIKRSVQYPFQFDSEMLPYLKRIYEDFIKLNRVQRIYGPRKRLKEMLEQQKPNFDLFYHNNE